MKKLPAFVAFLITLFVTASAFAQGTTCAAGATCVPPEDLRVFTTLLKDQKCRNETPPTFTADPITIIEDEEGRVFGTGSAPIPWKMHLKWCEYDINALGNVSILAAKKIPPTWGFRFRLKFSSGVLITNLARGDKFGNTVDVGVLWEGFYYKSVNLNLATGFRSVGLGVGIDLTKNFGPYIGYSIAYDGWVSNPAVGLSFAFW